MVGFGQVVLVLFHVCPHVQLFPRPLHVIFKRKLTYEIALTIATFTAQHGDAGDEAQTVGAVREPRATRRESQLIRDEPNAPVRLSGITLRSPLPKSIASETKSKANANY
jgi:hypothetical protein